MSAYSSLIALMQTHPNWPSVTDAELLTWLTEESVIRDKPTLGSDTIFAIIADNIDEWRDLTAADREFVKDLLYIHAATGVPTAPGTSARRVLVQLFGNSNIRTALGAAISETVSRLVEASIPSIPEIEDIAEARRRLG